MPKGLSRADLRVFVIIIFPQAQRSSILKEPTAPVLKRQQQRLSLCAMRHALCDRAELRSGIII